MGVQIATTRLFWQDRHRRMLCDGMYLKAAPGTVTAIIGPSGCGKSVFLRLLTGYKRPNPPGRIFFGEQELWSNYARVRDIIGYVPQAEVLIPELRVGESLDYRLRFRFRMRSPEERQRQIRKTCELLGLGDLDRLLLKPVGSLESSSNSSAAYPSGGERRRINIAHEILGQPQVMFMDEPTSGLASVEADPLIKQIKILAAERDIPVVMTIHSPSRDMFECFHDLVVMGMGGGLAYYGKRERAVEYFQNTTPIVYQGENPAEYILRCVSNQPQAGREAARRFEEHRGQPGYEYLISPQEQPATGGAATAEEPR